MLLPSDRPSLTALSTCLLSSQRTHLSSMQKLFNHLLALHLFCPHLSNISRNVYRAIHKTIQQFYQHLKAEQLDQKTIQFFVLQLQIDFALLRPLPFSPAETIPISDISVKNAATSPPNNPNPASNAPLLVCAAEPSVRRSTPEVAVGPTRAKTNNSEKADFQSSPNTREAPQTRAQNLTSRIFKLENFFADDVATYTSITAGIPSQYLFLMIKSARLKLVTQMLPFGTLPH